MEMVVALFFILAWDLMLHRVLKMVKSVGSFCHLVVLLVVVMMLVLYA